jgi:hypothetical protein
MAKDERPEGGVVVEVAHTIGIGEMRPLGAYNGKRPGEAAVPRVNPAWDEASGLLGKHGIVLNGGHGIPSFANARRDAA